MSEHKSIQKINDELRIACIEGDYYYASSLIKLQGAYISNKKI